MMKIKTKFAISNILMLITPIILIGVISVFCAVVFIIKFPVENIYITRAEMIDPANFLRAMNVFFQENPAAIRYLTLWALTCIIIMVLSTTVGTQYLSRSVRKPIEELAEATDKIRGSELDFDVLGSNYYEINVLCEHFDNMRSELKTADEQAKQMNRERNMLIANISHDLKTPVTSIKGYIEGIRDGVANTPEKMERYLDTIYAKTLMIDDMVNNLSTYSKLELSALAFEFTDGDLNEFIHDFFEDYRLNLEKNNMRLTFDLSDSKLQVKIDYEKMARVFSNIVNNSIKYKDGDSGSVNIKTYAKGSGAYIEISDTGIGISEDKLSKVFEGFYRVDTARTLNVQGSGLGLGIARQIVEKHGGKIWIRSREKGIVTTIYMPLTGEKDEKSINN